MPQTAPTTSPTPSPATTPARAIDALGAPASPREAGGYASLGQRDFLRLLTVQLQMQDPLKPVDNEEMLAQMAQFSALANSASTNATLEQIAAKLDELIEINSAALATTSAAPANPSPQPPTQD